MFPIMITLTCFLFATPTYSSPVVVMSFSLRGGKSDAIIPIEKYSNDISRGVVRKRRKKRKKRKKHGDFAAESSKLFDHIIESSPSDSISRSSMKGKRLKRNKIMIRKFKRKQSTQSVQRHGALNLDSSRTPINSTKLQEDSLVSEEATSTKYFPIENKKVFRKSETKRTILYENRIICSSLIKNQKSFVLSEGKNLYQSSNISIEDVPSILKTSNKTIRLQSIDGQKLLNSKVEEGFTLNSITNCVEREKISFIGKRSCSDTKVVETQSLREESVIEKLKFEKKAFTREKNKLKILKPKSTRSRDSTVKIPPKVSTVGGGKNGEFLRRIKREWRDAVKLGTAYDWERMESIVYRSQKKNEEEAPNKECSYIKIGPLGKNLLRWHFSVKGPANSPYENGLYHGRVLLPKDYPGSPPRIQMLTDSGRFIPGTDICLSASSYHPESWTPRWTVLSLVEGLRLHMLTSPNEIGGLNASSEIRKKLAEKSRQWRLGQISHSLMVASGLFLDDDNSIGSRLDEKNFEQSVNFRVDNDDHNKSTHKIDHENTRDKIISQVRLCEEFSMEKINTQKRPQKTVLVIFINALTQVLRNPMQLFSLFLFCAILIVNAK